jgi:hypothetical protein
MRGPPTERGYLIVSFTLKNFFFILNHSQRNWKRVDRFLTSERPPTYSRTCEIASNGYTNTLDIAHLLLRIVFAKLMKMRSRRLLKVTHSTSGPDDFDG